MYITWVEANGTGPKVSAVAWAKKFNFLVKKHVVLAASAHKRSTFYFVSSLWFSTNLVLANGTGPEFSATVWDEIFNFGTNIQK